MPKSSASGLRLREMLVVSILLGAPGCANVSYFTYQPTDEAHRGSWAGTSEGSFMEYTSHFWEQELDAGVTMRINIDANTRDPVVLTIFIHVMGSSTFAMTSPNISIKTDGAVANTSTFLGSFGLSVYGKDGEPGYFIQKLPTEEIGYTGLNDWWFQTGIDRYSAEGTFAIEPPDKITVILPDVVINGEETHLPPISFVRRELEGRFKLN